MKMSMPVSQMQSPILWRITPRLPFKVLMFGSTEYDSKHRLLDRFIKEARCCRDSGSA